MRRYAVVASLVALAMIILAPQPAAQTAEQNQPTAVTRTEGRQPQVQGRQRRLLQGRFRRLDQDQNGTISREEWSQRADAFDRLDVNRDGSLTIDELRGAARRGAMRRARTRARAVWTQLDADRSGSISRDEWKRRPEVFDRLDENKDGVLTPPELGALRRGIRR